MWRKIAAWVIAFVLLVNLGLLIPTSEVKAASKVALDKKTVSIYVGDSVKVSLKNASSVTWKSSDKKIATVTKSGKIKGLKKGNCVITATDKKTKKSYKCKVTVKKAPKLTAAETAKIKYTTFDNGYISMTIPKGWKVETTSIADPSYYTFCAYNPKETSCQIIVSLKSNWLKSYEAKQWYAAWYGADSVYAQLPFLEEKTALNVFENFSFLSANVQDQISLPDMHWFEEIENYGPTVYGGDLIRGTYYSGNDKCVEGLFTSTVKNAYSYSVFSGGGLLDVGLYAAYDTICITAPQGEFQEWQGILNKCLGSLKYSEEFVEAFNAQQASTVSAIKANSEIYNDISEMITSSWNERNTTYDITSQKQSDATLGYERVYDTETKEVYKVKNGFMDSYDGTKYKKIKDSMYLEPIAGYIN